jgi:amidohydrolase
LGTAEILNDLKDDFPGTVKLIFQPGEEKAPGGASKMIAAGALKNPEPDGILGQHVMVQLPVGKIGIKPGLYMASADEIYFTIKGKGGHGAMPDKNIDPVLITSHIIVALQQIVSRNANPLMPSVLSFGRIIAEGATNVIPNQVQVAGTFRTLDEAWRKDALERVRNMATYIAEGMGGTCEFHIVKGYPSLFNEERLTGKTKDHAIEYMGAEHVVDLDVWMASEDFAYYSHEIDACFYRLGVSNEEKGIISNVHTPTFNIDEKALEIGSGLMAWLCINNLS